MTDGRVLITGAAGFIGLHLVRRLIAGGRDVIALDSRRAPLGSPAGAEWRMVDIRDTREFAALLGGVDTVFHLASVHLAVHAGEPEFEAVNVAATAALASACAEAGVRRLVHTSSVGVYGHVADPPASENASCNPATVYERTKLAGERAVLAAVARSGLDSVVLRPAWVYGPGCGRTEKLLRAVRTRRFFFVGDGSNLRHPIFISDMIDAFLLAERAEPTVGGRTYNIAGPAVVTVRELVETAAAVQGVLPPRLSVPFKMGWMGGVIAESLWRPLRREPPFSRRSLAFFSNDNAFSIEAASRDLGFHPTTSLTDGLRASLAPA